MTTLSISYPIPQPALRCHDGCFACVIKTGADVCNSWAKPLIHNSVIKKLSVIRFLFMQAYFAIAEGLKQYATLKAAPGKAPEELMNDINPRMIEAHCTLKRKLKECGVGEALEDQLASIVSSGAPLEQRLQDSYDILFPWVPQLESRMPPEVQAFYA